MKYFDVSSCRPAPIACPACDVPPPRAVIDTPCRARDLDGAHDVLARPRHDDAERLDLIDAGVGGVERARDRVEADLAGDLLFELALQVQAQRPSMATMKFISTWPARSFLASVYPGEFQKASRSSIER